MAEDLSLQQERIVEQERAAIEYERKSAELEEARRFQLSMLPKEVPQVDGYDIAVFTHTATEVGGDYYDFHVDDGDMAITIGDATGHGARDGFPELMNAAGQQLGYASTLEAFAAAAKADDANGVIASLATVAGNWHGDQAPNDDVTFVVVRAV